MKALRLAAVSAIAMLAACSGGEGDRASNALANDAAAGNMAAMADDPRNPFAGAEIQMHERMQAAVGANASETWVKKMIEHHRGAVEMSNVLIGLGGDPDVLALARRTVTDQGQEIRSLERMLEAGGIGAGTSGETDPFRESDRTMHERMMAAIGADPSETWIMKMIEHHRGAVDMSDILLRRGGDAGVLAKARMTAQTQQREIALLDRMLAGGGEAAPKEDAPAAATEPKRSASPKAKAEARPAAAAPAPKAVPRAEPKAAPAEDPHAGHDMNNMSH